MPIIQGQTLQYPEASAVTLAAYARHIEVCECAFFGVRDAPQCEGNGCRTIWTKDERDWLQYYLAEAQWEIENIIHYFIGKRWVTDERHAIASPLITEWGYVVAGGVRAESTIASGAAVSHATDPAVIGPLATTVTDADEIVVYHPGSDIAIDPSGVTLSGGFVTIEIPRCRMVKPELADNPSDGLSYSNLSNFSATVDVVRIYNDNDNPATLVRQTGCSCASENSTACIYVRNGKIGSVAVQNTEACGCAQWVDLNYYAGRVMIENGVYTRFGRQAQDAIVRLAHVKMPHAPCDCDPVTNLWTRDREVIVDNFGKSMRGVTPFGPSEGAWTAWRFVTSPGMRLRKAAVL